MDEYYIELVSIKDKAIVVEKLSSQRKKMYFCKKKMIENLSDREIVQGLRQYDEKVTREFFYDTCHMAYRVDDKKYGLRYKTGMDFFSLAHEYYLRLCNHDWQQLENCKDGYTLAHWTMNGFHFLVRERLKDYSKGFVEESIEERASLGKVSFDAPVDNSKAEVMEMVEEICHAYYHNDRKSQSILRMILVMGMKGKEVAAMMGITPSAVSQRYHSMMENVVRPYFIKYYQPEPCIHSVEEVSCSVQMDRPMRSIAESSTAEERATRKSIWGSLSSWFSREEPGSGQHQESSVLDWHSRVTPSTIDKLCDNEVFVFGSDLRGIHCGGTAYKALRSFGAVMGQGIGPQGRCYAIPTIVGGLQHIRPYVDEFIRYAASHPAQVFLVTPVGCGVAGFTPQEMAPLFAAAKAVENIHLPESFWMQIANGY